MFSSATATAQGERKHSLRLYVVGTYTATGGKAPLTHALTVEDGSFTI